MMGGIGVIWKFQCPRWPPSLTSLPNSKSGSSIYSGGSGSFLDRAAEAPTYITITNCYVRGYVETYTA